MAAVAVAVAAAVATAAAEEEAVAVEVVVAVEAAVVVAAAAVAAGVIDRVLSCSRPGSSLATGRKLSRSQPSAVNH